MKTFLISVVSRARTGSFKKLSDFEKSFLGAILKVEFMLFARWYAGGKHRSAIFSTCLDSPEQAIKLIGAREKVGDGVTALHNSRRCG